MTEQNAFQLFIPLKIMGKARPRFGKNGAYHGDSYRCFQDDCLNEILSAIRNCSDRITFEYPCKPQSRWRREVLGFPINPAVVDAQFLNTGEGDRDNMLGSVLDVLVKAEIIKNDCFSSHKKGSYDSWNFSQTNEMKDLAKVKGVIITIWKDSDKAKTIRSVKDLEMIADYLLGFNPVQS